MLIRESSYSDADDILHLYEQSREYFRSEKIPQWTDGRPDFDDVFGDIDDGISYVAVENGTVGVMVCDFSGENAMTDTEEYAALQKMAVSPHSKGRGIAGEMIEFVKKRCRENGVSVIRCDTHPKNASMRRMLEKNGFTEAGEYRLKNGEDRVSYRLEI